MPAVYKDLPLEFLPHPVSGDVRPITDEIAIKRSIRNLLLTRPGEKPFNPSFGSTISSSLFENMSGMDFAAMEDIIHGAITKYEPRVRVTTVSVTQQDTNGVNIDVEYQVINSSKIEAFTTTITRVG